MEKGKGGGGDATGAKKLRKVKRPAAIGLFRKGIYGDGDKPSLQL